MSDPTFVVKAAAHNKIELTDKHRQEIGVLAGYGLTIDKMAAYFGWSKETFHRMVKRDPALADIIEKGKARMSTELRQLAIEQARAGSVPMIIFLLKTKENFRETDRLELTGADGGPITTKRELSVEEALAGIAKYDRLQSRLLKKA